MYPRASRRRCRRTSAGRRVVRLGDSRRPAAHRPGGAAGFGHVRAELGDTPVWPPTDHRQPAATQRGRSRLMPDIVCPECGQVTSARRHPPAAEEFCTHCDYPLFWAPTAVAMATPGVSSETTMRRLPGAGGRQRIGTRVCIRMRRAQRAQRHLLHPVRRRSRPEARAASAAASAATPTARTRARTGRRAAHPVVVVGPRRGVGDRAHRDPVRHPRLTSPIL